MNGNVRVPAPVNEPVHSYAPGSPERASLKRRLAEALRRTSRQVNTLENRVAPGLSGEIHRVRALLEEREREDHTRLKHLLRLRQESGA